MHVCMLVQYASMLVQIREKTRQDQTDYGGTKIRHARHCRQVP